MNPDPWAPHQRVVSGLVGVEVRCPNGAAVGVLELALEELRVVVVHRQLREGIVEGQVDDLKSFLFYFFYISHSWSLLRLF